VAKDFWFWDRAIKKGKESHRGSVDRFARRTSGNRRDGTKKKSLTSGMGI